MNKQQLAAKIWASANKMRSKIEANEYKDYILGFIFYKFLSEKEEEYLRNNAWGEEDIQSLTEEDERSVRDCQNNIGYFIEYKNLFSTWIKPDSEFDVSNVRDALSAFERLLSNSHKKVFHKVFETLNTGLGKLGDTSKSQTKSIQDLLYLIKDIPMDGKQDYDVLGFIYEYLISNFAANAGKKAGEFYTPHEVSLLMAEIVAYHLRNKEHIDIYDPTSGSGSLLINIGKTAKRYIGSGDNIKYYAQELKENTYNLTRMNLVMRGIRPDDIFPRNADTLEDDWPYFDEEDKINTYHVLRVDAVVSNPPYSQQWNPAGKENNPRFKEYGLAPKSKADYAFLLHDLYHVADGGIMAIVLPHGVLFRGGEEGEIRRNLIEKNKIDAIIGLPPNIFFGTGIPTIIMILQPKRENNDVLFIDASKGFVKEGKNNKLRSSDIKRIKDTYIVRRDVEHFAKKVSRNTIRENDYNLNIQRYVDSSEKAESWDIYASMFGGIPENEINDYSAEWKAFPGLKDALFIEQTEGYFRLREDDVKSVIRKSPEVQNFLQEYREMFASFDREMYEALIENAETVDITKKESEICVGIEMHLALVPLLDSYEAYQILDDAWTKTISADLEIIQTEGFRAVKQVDPNMVIKKKKNVEEEVQDGWKGHILPFELVQKVYFKSETEAIENDKNRVSEIESELQEAMDSLSEKEKDSSITNEEGDKFIEAELKKAVKEQDGESESHAIIKRVLDLMFESAACKKRIKDNSAELHLKTKNKIETLSDSEAKELLRKKWIEPLSAEINKFPETYIDTFVKKIEALANKYADTFADVENEIKETENELAAMLDELTGSEKDIEGLKEFKKILKGC
ncbi:MAG TPA: type I restriction-modification system subunit M [Lachnospiraceae bacterium]|nr:type I restriction-modification system subunit M [Lachnospiraceae bacterium]